MFGIVVALGLLRVWEAVRATPPRELSWTSLLSWILAFGVGFLWFGAGRRNRRLERWGAQVPLTAAQSRALEQLWGARRQGPSQVDPLRELSEADRRYLTQICRPGFRPSKFGRGETVWLGGVMQARARGFPDEQAALLAGMTLNRIGPANRIRRRMDDRIYGGSLLAKALGGLSVLLLGTALVVLWSEWRLGVASLAGSFITLVAAYWLSGGHHNPGLVESMKEKGSGRLGRRHRPP